MKEKKCPIFLIRIIMKESYHTIDNKIIYFTICSQFYSSYDNCDIYYVEKEENGNWSES